MIAAELGPEHQTTILFEDWLGLLAFAFNQQCPLSSECKTHLIKTVRPVSMEEAEAYCAAHGFAKPA